MKNLKTKRPNEISKPVKKILDQLSELINQTYTIEKEYKNYMKETKQDEETHSLNTNTDENSYKSSIELKKQ